MRRVWYSLLLLVSLTEVIAPVRKVQADEGMWLPSEPPKDLLKRKYQFDLTDDWLEHVRLASVRFNNGGSGGFVSADGLIVTNHHIGADQIQKLSPPGKDYLREGFSAGTRAKELKCPDLELNVLVAIEDVTSRVNAAVKPEMKPDEAFAARRAVTSQIENEATEKTGLRNEVVTLYQGGLYHLYRYKKYTDVRLVFAPEQGIAFFGGDTDNFEFPRFNLDVCFFRAYENDKPAQVQHYFRWATQGPKEGDLVFVTGNPGTTNRLETYARLKYRRDVSHPYTLYRLRTMEAAMRQFAEQGPEQARRAATDLHRFANARKAFSGQYQGLLDSAIMERKQQAEADLQTRFARSASPAAANPWRSIEQAQDKLRTFETPYSLLERGDGFSSQLFAIARHIVRMRVELPKPSAQRLREYRGSNLESLKFQLYSPAPIFADLERAKLEASLTFLAENLGGEHPVVRKVLAGKSPAVRAEQLVAGTKLFDPAVRKMLVENEQPPAKLAKDSMLELAALIDPTARELRAKFEGEVEEVERQAYAQLAALRFEAFGRQVAPDATFTLRLAFGTVKGYRVNSQDLPLATTLAGAFQRAEEQQHREPFVLPTRWIKGKEKLDLNTPFNFVSTADTIGGNSGSPVLNRAGELIGVNFDRNRHGLVRNFVYTEEQARHIAVHGLAVLEALRKLYPARSLVEELTR